MNPPQQNQHDRRTADYRTPGTPNVAKERYMDLPLDRQRRWLGLAIYIVFFVIVGGLAVWFFMQFNAPFRLAVGVVAFMIAYMLIMARWANKQNEENPTARM